MSEPDGHGPGGFIGRLLISPADARKASRAQPWTFGSDVERSVRGLQAPAFPPPVQPPGGGPASKSVPFGAFPGAWPLPFAEVLKPAAEVLKPVGVIELPKPVRQEARSSKARKPDLVAARPRAPDAAVGGRWEVLVRQAASEPKATPPAPPTAPLQPIDSSSARASFQRLLDKLSSQSRYGARAAKASAAPDPKPSERPAAGAGSIRQAVRRLGARPVGELLPAVGSFKLDEVLAINLSADGLAKARADNYQLVELVELPEFGLTITRLRPPESLNAVSARGRLFDLLPEDGFAFNRVYSPYRPGSGRPGTTGSVAAGSGKGCPSDRCFGSTLINWQARLAACASDVKVGIIDTGFDRTHPAFAGVRYEYREFLPEGSARASSQHGTGVLSLLAGSADSGTPGLIPDASYVIANAFFADADGQPISDTAQMLQALHWLRKSGASVVNLSFAGPEDELVHHAVRELTKAGAVVIAAAGNDGPGAPPSYPAAYPEVIAVTAVDRSLAAYRYASRGEHIDIAAPGVDVWTAIPGRREGPQTGTSFAVPYVTAVVAVGLPASGLVPGDDTLASKRRALARLQGNIKNLGGEGRDPTFGEGLVQAPASCDPPLVAVAANTPPPAQPWSGTVHWAVDQARTEPLVVGAWVSTVRVVGGDALAH